MVRTCTDCSIRMDLKRTVKNNKIFLALYQSVGSFVLRIVSRFVSCDNHLILFVSYGGRYYNDSPMYIYEQMLKDSRYKGYKLVWAFVKPEEHPDIPNKVKIDTLTYYMIALKARCWITNVVVERGLNFKPKHVFYFYTTHVTLPKLTGYDAAGKLEVAKRFRYKFDLSCAQSEYEKRLQYSMYGLKHSQVMVCGYPKNDRLANVAIEEYKKLRAIIGIPEDKKAILYAPTFRGNIDDDAVCPIDFNVWKEKLGDDFIILFRAHPVVASRINMEPYKPFLLDVSSYPDNVDLMIAADVLISDYSGIFFEFGVQDKPMYCFAYDYEEYTKVWKLYMDVRKEIPGGDLSEEELLKYIRSGRTAEMNEKLKAFKSKYITSYGNATALAVDAIYNNIGQ